MYVSVLCVSEYISIALMVRIARMCSYRNAVQMHCAHSHIKIILKNKETNDKYMQLLLRVHIYIIYTHIGILLYYIAIGKMQKVMEVIHMRVPWVNSI